MLLDPRTYGTSHKLITSSQQELSFQNRPVFYERNRIMKINFKIACSCQFYVEIDANEANVRYPLCSMERIGSLRNTFICQDTYQSPKLVLRTTLYKFGLISLQGLIDGGKLVSSNDGTENGGTGEWEDGRTGERENGRTGEWKNGRTGEWKNGGTGEWKNGGTGEWKNGGTGERGKGGMGERGGENGEREIMNL